MDEDIQHFTTTFYRYGPNGEHIPVQSYLWIVNGCSVTKDVYGSYHCWKDGKPLAQYVTWEEAVGAARLGLPKS